MFVCVLCLTGLFFIQMCSSPESPLARKKMRRNEIKKEIKEEVDGADDEVRKEKVS